MYFPHYFKTTETVTFELFFIKICAVFKHQKLNELLYYSDVSRQNNFTASFDSPTEVTKRSLCKKDPKTFTFNLVQKCGGAESTDKGSKM